MISVDQDQCQRGTSTYSTCHLGRCLTLPGPGVEQARLGIEARRGHQLGMPDRALKKRDEWERENKRERADRYGEGDENRDTQLRHVVLDALPGQQQVAYPNPGV